MTGEDAKMQVMALKLLADCGGGLGVRCVGDDDDDDDDDDDYVFFLCVDLVILVFFHPFLVQDFGGSQDLHQLLKVAAKSQRPDVPGLKRAEQLKVFMRWAVLCMEELLPTS